MKQALGLIETIGLVAAIEAADAAAKSANITLLGYENTKGHGKITVKFVGNVGAVKAGVTAGVAAASRIGDVYGYRVIPRPHDEIERLINNLDSGKKVQEPVDELVEAPAADIVAESVDSAETTSPEEAVEAKQCSATTKAGEQCKLPALPESEYCFVHRERADDRTEAPKEA